ncbi:3-oxoacyl-[acyl-carrier-protein] synthase III C-terminal domain-containing protein [Bacillus subtilis]|uniref:3-oxoacyl-[acyl-carrier-protein] synthase III C-terminal domain-containing protein n=1 Tax=Bacillus subtilis TaxID=1423 RepID=UPI0022E7B6DE|nr:3-oxoacyl-[acyl-carrier-protein] synthase III C-terminal domain-containing protein [Bacillus subtilis]
MNKQIDAFISHISCYIPNDRISVEEIAKEIKNESYLFPESDIQKLTEHHLFCSVPIERVLTLEEMLYEAASQTITSVIADQKPIDKIIFTHTSQVNYQEKNIFKKLIKQFQLSGTKCFSISQQNCASIHMALIIAKGLMSAETETRGIIIVTADKAFHPILRRIPDSVLGDSASACYISNGLIRGSHRLLHSYQAVDGSTYNGVRSDPEQIDWFHTTYYFAIRQAILTTLRESGFTLENIKLIVGSNVNFTTWEKTAVLLKISIDKIYTKNITSLGHLYCSDLLINLKSAIEDSVITEGDYYLTVSIGLGGTYGCALHQYLGDE